MFKSRLFFTGNSVLQRTLKAKAFNFPRFHSSTISLQSNVAPVAAKLATKVPPIITPRPVSYWLFGTSTLIFGIVVLGGLTRLTESGLSITEWKPITGTLPPMNQQQWEDEFEKYKESPEFKQLNSHITLDEFKFIYSMEWGHRLVGRGIGMFFILPAAYLWATKRISPHIKGRIVGLTALLGLQGFIGWWMVKSGLDEEQLAERKSKPTVSQYRLTTHLGAAFILYLGVLWTGFEILNENKLLKKIKNGSVEEFTQIVTKLNASPMKSFRRLGLGLLGLTFMTAMSGGMVAGLDAGLIYNTFPHMGENWVPSSNELMSPVFARTADKSDLWWRNLLENPTTVQLVHRIMATSTFFAVLSAHLYSIKHKAVLPKASFRLLGGLMGLVTAQASLGIFTLLYLVPIPLAALHQAGALALLTGCLAFSASMKKIRPEAFKYLTQVAKSQHKSILIKA